MNLKLKRGKSVDHARPGSWLGQRCSCAEHSSFDNRPDKIVQISPDGVGEIGEQSTGKILRADCAWAQTSARRNRWLEPGWQKRSKPRWRGHRKDESVASDECRENREMIRAYFKSLAVRFFYRAQVERKGARVSPTLNGPRRSSANS